MKRFIYLLSITSLLLSSCSYDEKQLKNEKNILGDWIKVGGERTVMEHDTEKVVDEPPDYFKFGLSFFKNNKAEQYPGFYKPINREEIGQRDEFVGNESKYIITEDSLKIFSPGTNNWSRYLITKLNTDTLKITYDKLTTTFVHLKTKPNKNPTFDKIILSTSPCFGPCPMLDVMISSDGTVVFNGQRNTTKTGLFIGKITKKQYNKIQDNFRRADFDSLKNKYSEDVTDQRTITTTFVKGDTIYKTVSDYGTNAPIQFIWAYTPLENLYQQIPLSSLKYPEYMAHIRSWLSFEKGNKIFGLEDSEKFLLEYYLSKGKISTAKFKPRFKIQAFSADDLKGEYDILTDGRYYKILMKGKPITIDIGFNFYDNNVKHWKWEKK